MLKCNKLKKLRGFCIDKAQELGLIRDSGLTTTKSAFSNGHIFSQ